MENRQSYKIAVLVPWRKIGKEIFVYLQKRDENAKNSPGAIGFFGGHAEKNETPEQAMLREIMEELNYLPKNYSYLGLYTDDSVPGQEKFVYYLQVEDNFENEIKIGEGEYGKWFSEFEILNEPKTAERNKVIVRDLIKKLKN